MNILSLSIRRSLRSGNGDGMRRPASWYPFVGSWSSLRFSVGWLCGQMCDIFNRSKSLLTSLTRLPLGVSVNHALPRSWIPELTWSNYNSCEPIIFISSLLDIIQDVQLACTSKILVPWCYKLNAATVFSIFRVYALWSSNFYLFLLIPVLTLVQIGTDIVSTAWSH